LKAWRHRKYLLRCLKHTPEKLRAEWHAQREKKIAETSLEEVREKDRKRYQQRRAAAGYKVGEKMYLARIKKERRLNSISDPVLKSYYREKRRQGRKQTTKEQFQELQTKVNARMEIDPEYAEKIRQKRLAADRRKNALKRPPEIAARLLAGEERETLKKKFLEVLETSAFIGITAKHLEIPASRVYGWMRDDPDFAESVHAAQGRTAERVGLALISKALNENDTQAQIFICKTLGKSLGFDEKNPVVNINVGSNTLDVTSLGDYEQKQMLTFIKKSKGETIIDVDSVDIDDEFDVDNKELESDIEQPVPVKVSPAARPMRKVIHNKLED